MAKIRTSRIAWGLAAVVAAVLAGFGGVAFLSTSADGQQKALLDAIEKGNVSAVRTLLQQGADVNPPITDQIPTPLETAINYKQTAVVKLLLDHGAKVDARSETASPLWLAATAGNVAAVKLLLDHGAKVNEPEPESGMTPLLMTVLASSRREPDKERAAVVKTLLTAGADPNARVGQLGMTALMMAARNWQTAMVQSLLAHGAKVNARSKDGMTALMHAAAGGSADVVKLLLKHGADVNVRTLVKGSTAWDFARLYGHRDLLPLLKQARAKR